MLTHVDLFSGIGGFALAAEWAGFETIVFCEKDEYCQKVLKKHWPQVPIIAEIRDFRWPLADTKHSGWGKRRNTSAKGNKKKTALSCQKITLLTGGFPCQPFSVAGKRRGKEDDRYLWPEMLAVISQVRPTWVLAENVVGIINMELDKCLSDLEGDGYETETFTIPACGVDAPHRRSRVWIVAHNGILQPVELSRGEQKCRDRIDNGSKNEPDADKFNGHGGRSYSGKISQLKKAELSRGQNVADNERDAEGATFREGSDKGGPDGQQENGDSLGNDARDGSKTQPRKIMAESCRERFQNRNAGKDRGRAHIQSTGKDSRREGATWPTEPDVGRVAYGISSRVDRLKALGNAIVPQVAYEIIRAIRMIEEKEEKG
jgi:DNA (cytosine-5)-methyltransferase 1